MKLLADMGVSVTTVHLLREAGEAVVHLRDEGLHRLPDDKILEKARREQRVVLTFDLESTAAPADDVLKNGSDYRHPEATRKNNPPAKIAAEGYVPLIPKAEYQYSPRRPPELRFDPTASADELPESRKAIGDKPGVILDYDAGDNMVSFEILDASKRMANHMSVAYAVTTPLRRPA